MQVRLEPCHSQFHASAARGPSQAMPAKCSCQQAPSATIGSGTKHPVHRFNFLNTAKTTCSVLSLTKLSSGSHTCGALQLQKHLWHKDHTAARHCLSPTGPTHIADLSG